MFIVLVALLWSPPTTTGKKKLSLELLNAPLIYLFIYIFPRQFA